MLAAMAASNQTVWNNQKELVKSQELLDEQFAVSTRMTVLSVNNLLSKLNSEERITESDIEILFKDWAKFRSRKDYRDFMMEWFLGVALDKLPPPKESETKEGGSDVQSSDGNKRPSEGPAENSGDGQTANVPQVQAENSSGSQRE